MKISFVFRFWFCFCCTRQSDTRKNWAQLVPLIPGSNRKTCSSGDEILKVSSCFHKTRCQEKVSWWTKFKQVDENFKIHVGKKCLSSLLADTIIKADISLLSNLYGLWAEYYSILNSHLNITVLLISSWDCNYAIITCINKDLVSVVTSQVSIVSNYNISI